MKGKRGAGCICILGLLGLLTGLVTACFPLEVCFAAGGETLSVNAAAAEETGLSVNAALEEETDLPVDAAAGGDAQASSLDAAGEVYGELLQGFDFTQENGVIEEYFPQLDLTVEEMLEEIISGGFFFSPAEIAGYLLGQMKAELQTYKKIFFLICLCGVLSALAQNLVSLSENTQAVQLGYYIIYLVLSLYLMELFLTCREAAAASLNHITEFLNVFLPAYYLSVGLSVGSASSMGFYRLSILVIYLVEYVFLLVLLPGTTIYFMLALGSGTTPGDRMASFLNLIKKGIRITLRSCMTLVGSLGAVRMLILPAADSFSYGTVGKILSVVPGVGQVSEVTLQMVGGALRLIKNGLGVLLMALLLFLAAAPLIKLAAAALVVRIGGAVTALLGNGLMNKMVERTSTALLLLFQVLGDAILLNLLVIGIAAASRG